MLLRVAISRVVRGVPSPQAQEIVQGYQARQGRDVGLDARRRIRWPVPKTVMPLRSGLPAHRGANMDVFRDPQMRVTGVIDVRPRYDADMLQQNFLLHPLNRS